MASTEYLCSDIACKFHDFSNDPLTVCPLCAKPVVAYTDEIEDGAEMSEEEYDGGDPYSEGERL